MYIKFNENGKPVSWITADVDDTTPYGEGFEPYEGEVSAQDVYYLRKNADGGIYFDADAKAQAIAEAGKYMRRSELKAALSATDYKAIKYAEGLISAEEYAPTKAERQALREQINALEAGES
jgi:hypothetical protein